MLVSVPLSSQTLRSRTFNQLALLCHDIEHALPDLLIYREKALTKIKENFKQKIFEIDKGIEPGLSMAGAGESIGRDMGEKNNKKGKVTPIKELTGDETGASIGDQKADELHKKGISLSTFKKRNYL